MKEKYDNIHLISTRLDNYMTGTALEDGLRILTLNKYGEYFFDLDVISVRPVTDFRNFIAAESDDCLGSGVIHADFKHPIMELAVKDFATNYRAHVWGHNGPALLLRVLKSWCNADYLEMMDYVNVSCNGFNVLHYSSFYLVDYSEAAEEFFIHRLANKTGKPISLTDQVVGVHTWNKLTYNKPITRILPSITLGWLGPTARQCFLLHRKSFNILSHFINCITENFAR
uniref:Alpha 1,4-glycosyltransferase domain-containing protein n=1 Tax=Daphnia galeata TaxID=27404 RepID=A0A8J2WLK3_9CRUS|nr:unnamed protein product [Daphnia galeata]